MASDRPTLLQGALSEFAHGIVRSLPAIPTGLFFLVLANRTVESGWTLKGGRDESRPPA